MVRWLRDLWGWAPILLILTGIILATSPSEAIEYGPPIKISITPQNNGYPITQINNKGQVVWIGGDGTTTKWQIYFYDGKVTKNISNNNTNNAMSPGPLLNANGWVTWNASTTENSLDDDVWLYRNGITRKITNSGLGSLGDINDLNQIVYYDEDLYYDLYRWLYSGGSSTKLMSANGNTDVRINNHGQIAYFDDNYQIHLLSGANDQTISSNDPYSNGRFELNDLGQVVWESSVGSWSGNQIYFYDGHTTKMISNTSSLGELIGYGQMNNSGQFVWNSPSGGITDIYLYSNGVVKNITSNGQGGAFPQINDKGQIVWNGPDSTGFDHIHLYSDGVVQVFPESAHSSIPAINNLGQIAYVNPSDNQVYLLSPVGINVKHDITAVLYLLLR